MKIKRKYMRWLFPILLVAIFDPALAEDDDNLLQNDQPPYRMKYGEFEITFGSDPRIDGAILILKNRRLIKSCSLREPARRLLLSNDQSVVIVSDDGYIRLSDILSCKENRELREDKVPGAYRLTDINLRNRIYVSAKTLPSDNHLPCVATVAKIGSTKNLVSLPGALVPGASEADLLNHAFSCPRSSFISPDGRYVALEKIDCSENGRAGNPDSWDDPSSRGGDPYSDPARFTGVWDVKENKRVLFSLQQYTEKEISVKCSSLFSSLSQIRDGKEAK